MPSAKVLDQYPMIGGILDPPLYLLDTTFKLCFRKLATEQNWLIQWPQRGDYLLFYII